ncbi:Glycosyltransferase, ALG3 [Pelomyxa schiedti]|nr:Glycosyltransferase, ALG3 [Pelomyxa schiedti]
MKGKKTTGARPHADSHNQRGSSSSSSSRGGALGHVRSCANNFWLVAAAILMAEVVGVVAIILFRPYTEIDWIAYMQEVEGFLGGERDYTMMKGDTGPLVYPAGFVYLFSALFHVTGNGKDIFLAQCIWACLFVYTLCVVLAILKKSEKKVPAWAMLLLCISLRIHSIFVLRLFNDCFAMALLYTSILLFLCDWWSVGCAVFSFAVSIKMNVLLYAPGLLTLLLQRFGMFWTPFYLAICGFIQLALGLPFLIPYPFQYIKMAFDLGRVFLYKWTVNWKFIPEEIFISKQLALLLLSAQMILLLLFAFKRWRHLAVFSKIGKVNRLAPDHILRVLFTSNFIGIVCARSLHFQFYVWYFHTLVYLAWMTPYPNLLRFDCTALCH